MEPAESTGRPLAPPAASRPIDLTPDDVLILIFEAAGGISALRRPFTLSQVCRRWRDIFRGMPGHFACIDLADWEVPWVTAMSLSPAGHVLVSVLLDMSNVEPLGLPMLRILSFLTRIMRRTLCLRLICADGQAITMRVHLSMPEAPYLNELDVTLRGPRKAPLFPQPKKAPLRTLLLNGVRFELGEFGLHGELREMTLCNVLVVLAALCKILDAAPALRTLSLRNIDVVDHATSPSPTEGAVQPSRCHESPLELLMCHSGQPAQLQALADLVVQAGLSAAPVQFTLVLLHPTLAETWTREGVFHSVPSPLLPVGLSPFAFAGNPCLRELILSHVEVAPKELYDAIRVVPALRTLGMYDIRLSRNAPTPSAAGKWRHPSLCDLFIRNIPFDKTFTRMLDFLSNFDFPFELEIDFGINGSPPLLTSDLGRKSHIDEPFIGGHQSLRKHMVFKLVGPQHSGHLVRPALTLRRGFVDRLLGR